MLWSFKRYIFDYRRGNQALDGRARFLFISAGIDVAFPWCAVSRIVKKKLKVMRSRFLLHTFPDIHIYIDLYMHVVWLWPLRLLCWMFGLLLFVKRFMLVFVGHCCESGAHFRLLCWMLAFVMVFWKITKSIFDYTRGNMVVDGWAKSLPIIVEVLFCITYLCNLTHCKGRLDNKEVTLALIIVNIHLIGFFWPWFLKPLN